MPTNDEIPLHGGNVSTRVVRVGKTVRKPAGPWTPTVDAYLRHLESVGFEHAPKSLGIDEQGRHVLEYVVSDTISSNTSFWPDMDLVAIGSVIRDFHDASESFVVPTSAVWNVTIEPGAEDLIIHHDLAPWNLVLGEKRFVFIDWDGAGPGSRIWDLAYACTGFVPLAPDVEVASAARRLVLLADGYRLDELGRGALAQHLVRRSLSMYELLKKGSEHSYEPWSRLWDEGHGSTWLASAEFTEQNMETFRSALLRAT